MKDGERIVSVMSLDPRVIGNIKENPKKPNDSPEVHGFAATSNGFAMRFRTGTICRTIDPQRTQIRSCCTGARSDRCRSGTWHRNHSWRFRPTVARWFVQPSKSTILSGAGKGVTLIKIAKTDKVLGFKASAADRDLLVVETNRGAQKTISTAKYRVTARGGRGIEIQKNGKISAIISEPIKSPDPLEPA